MTDTAEPLADIVRKAVEADIEERVYKKIKNDIFKLKIFGSAGAALIALLVVFHKPIFETVVDLGGKNFREQIEKSIEKQKAENDTMIARYEIVRQGALKETDNLTQLSFNNRSRTSELQAAFKDESEKLQLALGDAKDAREALVQRAGSAQVSADDVKKRVDDLTQQVNDVITNQNQIVSRLNAMNAAPNALVDTKQTPIVKAESKVTVYFQFAGFTRPQAEGISRELDKRGWSIPGEERTTAALNTNQIRFNPADAATADRLLADANEVLKPYGITMTGQANTRLTAGIPEIWLFKP
jgi:hypothetical protein